MHTSHPRWHQVNIAFASARTAENHLAADLGPVLARAEASGLIEHWWFLRKQPWRLRYLPTPTVEAERAEAAVHGGLRHLRDNGSARFATTIYEPETHAFGGAAGMRTAHALFHTDSRNICTLLTPASKTSTPARNSGQRRELSLLLLTALMRAAGLDRYEQGDVWARIAAHRDSTSLASQSLITAAQTLITVDTAPGTELRATGTLVDAEGWFAAFERTGRALRRLAEAGELTRGIRAVITHHGLFHWNRMGLSTSDQAALACAAQHASFADPRKLPPSPAAGPHAGCHRPPASCG